MSELTIGLIATASFMVLSLAGMPLGFSFAVVGFVGFSSIKGLAAAVNLVASAPYAQVASFVLSAVPMFILMGQLAFHSEISRDLFETANKWLARFPGGLGLAAMMSCTGFAACTGSSLASAATMSSIAFPEMRKNRYDPGLATGIIAVGGTLGILIPPSTIFIIIGIITETSIGELFIAGIIPGLILSTLFLLTILLLCILKPSLGPKGLDYSWRDRIASIYKVWGMVALLLVVIGGLYFGFFSPSEAGSIGAAGAFLLAIFRRMPASSFVSAFKETAQITTYMLFILIGASIYNTFFVVAGISDALKEWLIGFNLPPIGIIIIMLLMYLPLGMFLDTLGMIFLTVPIFFPLVVELGYDPVWFGVVVCMVVELGMITPPVAINLYVVRGITKVSISTIARGIVLFIFAYLIGLALIVAFPRIALFLPSFM